jgi:hypothetical protein
VQALEPCCTAEADWRVSSAQDYQDRTGQERKEQSRAEQGTTGTVWLADWADWLLTVGGESSIFEGE